MIEHMQDECILLQYNVEFENKNKISTMLYQKPIHTSLFVCVLRGIVNKGNDHNP